MDEKKASEAARALGRLGAAEGGKARAAKLSPEERSEIARQAAAARWGTPAPSNLPLATYGSPDRPLRISNMEIPCYVLDDGRRVLVQRGMVTALGMARGSSAGTGGDRLAKFTAGKALEPFVSEHLSTVT